MEDLARRLRKSLHPARIHRTQIKWWESGRVPGYAQMCAIADALGIPHADILSRVREEMGTGFVTPPDLRLIHKQSVVNIGSTPDGHLSQSDAGSTAHRGTLDDAAAQIAELEAENARLHAENTELQQRLEILRVAVTAATVERLTQAGAVAPGSSRARGRRTPSGTRRTR